jgi:hypothetical protein
MVHATLNRKTLAPPCSEANPTFTPQMSYSFQNLTQWKRSCCYCQLNEDTFTTMTLSNDLPGFFPCFLCLFLFLVKVYVIKVIKIRQKYLTR